MLQSNQPGPPKEFLRRLEEDYEQTQGKWNILHKAKFRQFNSFFKIYFYIFNFFKEKMSHEEKYNLSVQKEVSIEYLLSSIPQYDGYKIPFSKFATYTRYVYNTIRRPETFIS